MVRRKSTIRARHDIASLQAWRKRAGVDEPPHALAAEGPNGLELQGEFEAAAAIWTELGRPYETALALADVATEAALRRSLELLTDLGARATATVVTRRLRALGARDIPRGPRPTTLVNPAELTTREVEVVQLLADASATQRSPSFSFPSAPLRTTSRRSCASSARAAVPRRSRTRGSSASSAARNVAGLARRVGVPATLRSRGEASVNPSGVMTLAQASVRVCSLNGYGCSVGCCSRWDLCADFV